jgi:glucosamine-6-phosphate deaminase
MFKLYVLDNYEEVSKKASEVVIKVVEKGNVTLGLATGSSPVGMYKHLVEAHKNGLYFNQVTTVNLDEYVGISREHSQSYYHFMFEHLFKHVDVKYENIHIPFGQDSSEKMIKDYEDFLSSHPQDLQVLGIGSNGHIGFNEPGTSFDSTVHVIELKEETREDNARFFESIDDVPTHAITMGIKDIMRAKEIVLIATGEKKAQAVYEMVYGEITEEVPCTILQKHENVIVIVDKEAGKLLNK